MVPWQSVSTVVQKVLWSVHVNFWLCESPPYRTMPDRDRIARGLGGGVRTLLPRFISASPKPHPSKPHPCNTWRKFKGQHD